MSKNHKVVITGTGRNGTTFLVQLLTWLGLDTGFSRTDIETSNKANAGLEVGIYERWDKASKSWIPNPQYIVKSPLICDKIDQAMGFGNVTFDHVYIPMREIDSVVASRVRVGHEDGGYWGADNPKDQKLFLLDLFHQLIFSLAKHDIPYTLMVFPQLASDPLYCYEKLSYLMKDIPYETFLEAFEATSQQGKIHRFEAAGK
ncbi:MAG: hypothetical protein V7754_11990 [Halioglobus sp.]